MTTPDERHLEAIRIAEILAEADPTASERRHLDGCERCRAGIERLRSDLRSLGRGAMRFSPAPGRPLALPAERPGRRRAAALRTWGIGLAAAAGLTAAVFFASLEPPRVGLSVADAPPVGSSLLPAVDPEMLEIQMLADNAMPPAYQAISESIETDPEEEEGFMDFLIPDLQEDVS